MRRLLILCLLFLPALVIGQSAQVSVHPTVEQTAAVLHTISAIVGQNQENARSLSLHFDGPQIASGLEEQTKALIDISNKWGSIITVSQGKQMPLASDMFTLYTSLSDFLAYSESVTREDRFRGGDTSLANQAVSLVRAQSQLMAARETLRYALADQIDRQEHPCATATARKRH